MQAVQIDDTNHVVQVIEAVSLEWCQEKIGGNWVMIEPDDICGIGYVFDSDTNIFYPPDGKSSSVTTIKHNKKVEAFKQRRNILLNSTDKYVTVDFPHASDEVRQAWLDYRQALRDLPVNTEDPENPVWPVAPSP